MELTLDTYIITMGTKSWLEKTSSLYVSSMLASEETKNVRRISARETYGKYLMETFGFPSESTNKEASANGSKAKKYTFSEEIKKLIETLSAGEKIHLVVVGDGHHEMSAADQVRKEFADKVNVDKIKFVKEPTSEGLVEELKYLNTKLEDIVNKRKYCYRELKLNIEESKRFMGIFKKATITGCTHIESDQLVEPHSQSKTA